MGEQAEGKICGRDYHRTKVAEGVKPRIVVDGIFHIGGTDKHPNKNIPIRFKSIERAENHIRTMRLEKPE